MNLYQQTPMSVEDYFKVRESSDELLEYIDGMVYMTPSPSTKHQRISRKRLIKLDQYLTGKPCEVFHVPFDIELKNEQMDETKIVIPDLSVICDKVV
jgi:Uma2 family endonuclease